MTTVLTVAGLTLREAFRRRVLLALSALTLLLIALSAWGFSRLAATGRADREGEWFTVALPADDVDTAVPELVADVVRLGAQVHAVEPARISLEERLLGILRANKEDDE